MKNVAILGFGTVGSGVYEMLSLNAEKIEKAAGTPMKVKYILDIRDFSDREDAEIFTKDFNVILEDPEVDIVAEVIGGIHPAYDFTKAALLKGKSVVTSNKELVATKGCELLAIAKEKGVYKGRKPIERPNFNEVVSLWKSGTITAVEAMKRLDMKPSTFYRKVKNYCH